MSEMFALLSVAKPYRNCLEVIAVLFSSFESGDRNFRSKERYRFSSSGS